MKTLDQQSAPVQTTMSQAECDVALVQWKVAKEALDQAKEAERMLHDKIVAESGLFDPNKAEGTQRVDIGNGWVIKAVKKISFSLANKEGETFAVLEQLAKMGEASARAAKELCSFEPRLRKTEFNKLTDAEKALFDDVLTTKAGAPSLELIPPK